MVVTTTKGMVFNIQRYSIDDGPGIRTTVFLKGCPLTCLWCSNPESQERAPQLLHRKSLCKQCYRCVASCPEGAISVGPEGIVIDRDVCQACGTCVEACPHDALRISGKEMSVEEVMAVVKRDADFYRDSGGGVTISGGEALMQPEFTLELLKACKEAGFHTCLDTSGQGSLESLRKLIPYVDLFYYDIKHIDPDIHYRYTGCTNKQILRNFIEVASSKVPLVVRIPVIPGFNDSVRDIGQIAELVATEAPHASVHLLPYHRYGQQKYAQLGREYPMPEVEPPTQEFLDAACAEVRSRGLHCEVAK